MSSELPPHLLTVREVAAYLRLGLSTTYNLVESGRLPAFRIGGSYRVKQADLDAFLETSLVDLKNPRATDRGRKRPATWKTFRHLNGERLRQAWDNDSPTANNQPSRRRPNDPAP